MDNKNNRKILFINLTTRVIEKKPVPQQYLESYIGGRGLAVRYLWDIVEKPGLDPLSPDNPLIFMTGPFVGLPAPAASRICVMTKSPHTSPVKPLYKHSSSVTYSNIGGFFAPELRFAGYDGIIITGKSPSLVYVSIHNDQVEIRDAKKYRGMDTDKFEKEFKKENSDPRYQALYIGSAGENLVEMASIMHTSGRAAGRGGAGCVMGAKNLKAVTVRGTGMPEVADHKNFLSLLEDARGDFKDSGFLNILREHGTAYSITHSSSNNRQAVKNFKETSFADAEKIGSIASKDKIWNKNQACYCCPIGCKKSGVVRSSPYAHIVHDAPEYETGTMMGANLLVSNLEGMLKSIFDTDDYGMDIISVGNTIGFLMECYEKGLVTGKFLDNIDLKWGNVDGVLKMIKKIARKEGIGRDASRGVKHLSGIIGRGSEKFAIHIKGQELAGWNPYFDMGMGISYATSNRGACHLNGGSVQAQNRTAVIDSTGICLFADDIYKKTRLKGKIKVQRILKMLNAITGFEYTEKTLDLAGERIFTLEKMFNAREGFGREDDMLPDRFFEDAVTAGQKENYKMSKDEFTESLAGYYRSRGWNELTSHPEGEILKKAGI